jgi:ribosome-associated protein
MNATPGNPTIDAALQPFFEAAQGKKASRIVLLHVKELTSIADAFLICSGQSHRQVTAIGEHIRLELKKQGLKPLNVEGLKDGQWVLMDYGHILIHVFYEPLREFYDLEGLWADAPRHTHLSADA